MKLISCLMTILLAGCATETVQHGNAVPAQVVVVKTCVARAEILPVPKTHMRPGMDLKQKTAAALADEADLEKYAADADGKLRACAEAANGPALQ